MFELRFKNFKSDRKYPTFIGFRISLFPISVRFPYFDRFLAIENYEVIYTGNIFIFSKSLNFLIKEQLIGYRRSDCTIIGI